EAGLTGGALQIRHEIRGNGAGIRSGAGLIRGHVVGDGQTHRADDEPGLVASSPVDADEAQPRTDQYTQVPAAEQEPAEAPARRQEERQPRWEAEEATGRHEVVQEYAEYGEDAEERTEAPQRGAEQDP
ncbi:hypothetical protein BLX87_21130, partial [Bacillus sp. VT-16-64]